MAAYNFPLTDARAIIFGLKSSAVKPRGKRAHVAVGQIVHAFCGNTPPEWSKSPDCHRLIEAPCVVSDPVAIDASGMVRAGELVVNNDWLRVLAHAEGFASFSGMQAHLERVYGFPYHGQLIRWNPSQAEFRAQWPLIARQMDAGRKNGMEAPTDRRDEDHEAAG